MRRHYTIERAEAGSFVNWEIYEDGRVTYYCRTLPEAMEIVSKWKAEDRKEARAERRRARK